ncbi:MAG: phytanoyl-CoA dioxygenase family protein [Spirosomaceae bacterium]|nr:phytanoyl-CoA dioxygenase family protein [Spirosomataceae bacterium]
MKNLSTLNTLREHILINKTISEKDWNMFQQIIFEYGIGLEETLQFLYVNRPNIQDFQDWIKKNEVTYQNENIAHLPDVLSPEDLEFWDKNGYIVIKNAISKEDCEQTQNAILHYLEASLDNPDSWYKNHEAKEGLMVLFTKHPTLEKNRASLTIQKAYQQLYKTDKIYRVIDKVSFNPPESESYKFRGSLLHWDMNLKLPIHFKLQGLLYLTDVKHNSGAFHCVAGFHTQIENWLKSLPKNTNPRELAIQELKPVPVLGNAGDFIIWHQALPHCATPNTSDLPRMVQYLTYFPIENHEETSEWI